MAKKILINTGSNFLVTFLKLVIALIMTPILVKALGNHDYGIWEVIVSVIGYMGLLDLGLRPSVTRNIAFYRAQDNTLKVQKIYSTALAFMIGAGLICLSVFLVWSQTTPEVLAEDSAEDIQRYSYLLIIIGCQLFIQLTGTMAESVLEGYHKYYLKNNITIVNTLIGNFLIWSFINESNAILVVAGVSALGISVKYILYFILVANDKDLPLKPNPFLADRATLTELLKFGGKSFIQGVTWRIQQSIDPILIALILNPAQVIYYAIPSNLINYYRSISMTLTQAFLPFFSELAGAKGNQNDSVNVFLIASRFSLLVIIPISLAIFLFGSDFIGLWVGQEYQDEGTLILWALNLTALLNYLDPFASKYLTAHNKHGIYAKLTPIAIVINIAITCTLMNYIGVLGAAIGTLIPTLIFFPIYFSFRSKVQEITWSTYISSVVAPHVIPALVSFVVTFALIKRFEITSFISLLILGAVFALSYYILSVVFVLNKTEKSKLISKVRRN